MGPSIEEQRDRIRKQNKIDKIDEGREKKPKKKIIKKQRQRKIIIDKDYRSEGWVKKRKKILYRDGYICHKCGSKKNLVIHHKKYRHGYKLYQVPDEWLITWCRECHDKHHKEHGKDAYIVVGANDNKKRKKKKNKRNRYNY